MAAETIDARRAYELKIVTEVTPQSEALNAALALARVIHQNCAPLAVRLAKRLIDEGLEASLPTALSMEMDSTALLFVTDDKAEGIAAFIEKRPPNFKGQ
jgi:enoyl-CoA hydratase